MANDPPPSGTRRPSEAELRRARQAEALRANLRRRKTRERGVDQGKTSEAEPSR